MNITGLSWQILLVGSALLYTLGSVFAKHQVSKASSFHVLIYKYIASFFWMSVLWLVSVGEIPKGWWMLFIYGITGGISIAAYTAALRHSVSKTTMMIPIKRLMSIILSIFVLGEAYLFNLNTKDGRLIFLGFLLVPVIYFLFNENRGGVKRWNKLIWFHVTYSSVATVVAKVFMKSIPPVTVLLFTYLGSLVTAIVIAAVRHKHVYVGKKFALRGLMHGTITSFGVFFYFTALSMATVTETTLLRMPLVIILPTLVGLFLFKEKDRLTKKKVGGIIVAGFLLALVLMIDR